YGRARAVARPCTGAPTTYPGQMTEYDPKTGKVRPTWTVRFSPWMTLAGSALGGAVCGLVVIATLLTGSGASDLAGPVSVFQGAVLIFGATTLGFLLLGPTLAWGLGFMLRNVANHYLHVIAFGALGVFVSYSIGVFVAGLLQFGGLADVLAPAAGIGAAVGRW